MLVNLQILFFLNLEITVAKPFIIVTTIFQHLGSYSFLTLCNYQ